MNIFILALSLISFSTPSFAELNMKPGLWEIKTKVKTATGETDPMAKMRESLAKMPPEQRKQVEAMMAKQGMSTGGIGLKACYTPEMIKDPESMAKSQQKGTDCTTKIASQTSAQMVIDFKCKNGTNGTGQWNFHGSEKYDGSIKMTNAKGENSEITYDAKFLNANCGDVKAFTPPKK